MTDTSSLAAAPLWERTRALLARAIAALGGAAAIAAIALLSRAQRREIVAWLAPLEHIVRKLLLAEAARLETPPPQRKASAPLQAHTRNESVRSPRALDLSRPESWPAQFSLSAPRDPHLVPNARAPRIRALWGPTIVAEAPKKTPANNVRAESLRLAQRFEAVRRVLENPLPHAARLARLLVRAVRRFPEIVRRYALMAARALLADREDQRLSVEATGAALIAVYAFPDSS